MILLLLCYSVSPLRNMHSSFLFCFVFFTISLAHKHMFHSQANIREQCHEFNAINWICTGKDLYWVVVKDLKIFPCVNLKSRQSCKSNNSSEHRCENTLHVKWKEAAVWHRKTLRQRNVNGSAWTAPGFIWIDSYAVCLHKLNWGRSAGSSSYSITAFYYADSLQWSLSLLSVCRTVFQIWVWKLAAHQGRTTLLHFLFCFLNFALVCLHFDKEKLLTTKTGNTSQWVQFDGLPKFAKRKSSCLVTYWQWSKMEMLERTPNASPRFSTEVEKRLSSK